MSSSSFDGSFPFLWEFSHFYENLKKACPQPVKGKVSNNKLEVPNFLGIFPIL
jgi:hypothetical protein